MLSCSKYVPGMVLKASKHVLELCIMSAVCGANGIEMLHVMPSIFICCVCGIRVLFTARFYSIPCS